jgi:hypothetical protein
MSPCSPTLAHSSNQTALHPGFLVATLLLLVVLTLALAIGRLTQGLLDIFGHRLALGTGGALSSTLSIIVIGVTIERQ